MNLSFSTWAFIYRFFIVCLQDDFPDGIMPLLKNSSECFFLLSLIIHLPCFSTQENIPKYRMISAFKLFKSTLNKLKEEDLPIANWLLKNATVHFLSVHWPFFFSENMVTWWGRTFNIFKSLNRMLGDTQWWLLSQLYILLFSQAMTISSVCFAQFSFSFYNFCFFAHEWEMRLCVCVLFFSLFFWNAFWVSVSSQHE